MSVHCAPALGQVRGGWEGGRDTGGGVWMGRGGKIPWCGRGTLLHGGTGGPLYWRMDLGGRIVPTLGTLLQLQGGHKQRWAGGWEIPRKGTGSAMRWRSIASGGLGGRTWEKKSCFKLQWSQKMAIKGQDGLMNHPSIF